jgi:hypothetical protein
MIAASIALVALAALTQQDPPVVPEGDTGGERPRLETTINGYLDQRFTTQAVRDRGLIPADEVPAFIALTEANLQLKLRWGERGLALGDASFFYQRAAGFPGAEKDLPAYRPLAVLSELYGSYAFGEHAHLTLGKKRVVWGPGFALNPTDLLNPPKDPTDPAMQRAGAWLARLEFPYERFTVTLVGAARALREHGGVPSALAVWPDSEPRDPEWDDQLHVAAAARLYLLVADTDVNLMYYFTHLYQDAFRNKSRLGLSVSRLVGKALEVHAEVLGQLGSTRLYVDECVGDEPPSCAFPSPQPLLSRPRLDEKHPQVRALVGGRYTFADDSMFGLDWAAYSDGYSPRAWRTLLAALRLARAQGFSPAALLAGGMGAGGGGTPQRFTFEPLRRHYLFVNYLKPRIRDDFTVNLTLLAALEDLSAQFAPQASWSVREWVNLTLHLFLPVAALRPTEVWGEEHSELGLFPADFRVIFSARLFY